MKLVGVPGNCRSGFDPSSIVDDGSSATSLIPSLRFSAMA